MDLQKKKHNNNKHRSWFALCFRFAVASAKMNDSELKQKGERTNDENESDGRHDSRKSQLKNHSEFNLNETEWREVQS